jgi:hypothetical protein
MKDLLYINQKSKNTKSAYSRNKTQKDGWLKKDKLREKGRNYYFYEHYHSIIVFGSTRVIK